MASNRPARQISIRLFRPSDEAAVAEICYQTGYMGGSLLGRFTDRRLFALIFSLAYPDFAPDCCFVACDESGVVGYCFAVTDSTTFQNWYAKRQKRLIVRRMLTHTFWRSPRDVRQLLIWAKKPSEHTDHITKEFPAHFHINILSGFQRSGVGTKLLEETLSCLERKGVEAVHLQTSSKNTSAIHFYRKIGFELLESFDRNLWDVPGVRSLIMGFRFPARHTNNDSK